MPGKWHTPKIALLVLASLVLAWLGARTPVHFRAIAPSVLERAGMETKSVADLSAEYVASGRTGPLGILWNSGIARPGEPDRARMVALLADHPVYENSGGPSPYYEDFLASFHTAQAGGAPDHIVELLVTGAGRDAALAKVRQSGNQAAHSLLDVRALGGWRSLMPVNTPAGRPLDAAILSLAFLADSGCLHPNLETALVSDATRAKAGDKAAQSSLEDALLSTLVLGRRCDWTTLTEIYRHVGNTDDLADFAARTASTPTDFPTLFSATMLNGDYAPVGRYLAMNPGRDGVDSLSLALADGKGALATLFTQGQLVYRPPTPLMWLDRLLYGAKPTFSTMALQRPKTLLALKCCVLFFSGLSLALALGHVCRTAWSAPCATLRSQKCLPGLATFALALGFAVLFSLLIEPNLFRYTTERPVRAVFETGSALVERIQQQKTMNANSLDPSSILSLILFFFVQLAVYIFSVLRLNRLRGASLPAETKLKLLENDDNLFDLGLYIGLAGTVASLLMLSMNIIQASLVAAYSSTLFGILFAAFLKVVNIRTFRRNLIIEIQSAKDVKKD